MVRPIPGSVRWNVGVTGFFPNTSVSFCGFNSMVQRRSSAAFTLLELLVVIAIIGVMVGLLLPAVQAARAAARRVQCVNHIKQITLAMHNYHDTQGSMPVSFTGSDQRLGGSGSGFHSWLARLLPQMEQSALYDQIDFESTLADRIDYASDGDYLDYTLSPGLVDAEEAGVVVEAFLCPSDPGAVMQFSLGIPTGPGSYAANIGLPRRSTSHSIGEPLKRQNGVVGLHNPVSDDTWQKPRIRFADMTDGTANTMAVSERLIATVYSANSIFGHSIVLDTTPISMQSFCAGGSRSRSLEDWVAVCEGVSLSDAPYSESHGHSWMTGWTFAANHFMPVMPINRRSCHVYGGEDDGMNLVTPSSHHAGGVVMSMADGSVSFMTESIDRELYWALGSNNGRETVEMP